MDKVSVGLSFAKVMWGQNVVVMATRLVGSDYKSARVTHKAYLGDVCSLSTLSLQNPALPTIPCSALSSKLMTWECRRVHSVAQSHLLCFLHPLTPSASKTLSSHSPPPAHHQLFFLHFPICQFLPISLRKNERMQE